MKTVVRALGLAVLLVTAGCAGSVQTTPTSTTTTEATPASTSPTATTETTTSTTTETTATTETTEAPPENPWESETVSVSVVNSVNRSRSIAPLVNQTLAYWNAHDSEFGEYNVTFVSEPQSFNADVIVELVPKIEECGEDKPDVTVGCASILDAWDAPDRPEVVRVVAGYTNSSTARILKHEFGHIMGVEHGMEPMPVMKAIDDHTHFSQPDAQSRPVPWRNSTLSVYVGVGNLPGHDRDAVREQVRHALGYFESGGGGVPGNVSFVRTSNRSAADIQIWVPDGRVECQGEVMDAGSCWAVRGYSTDSDESLEYYSRAEIRVWGLDEDAYGWHVGRWVAVVLGLSGDELPDVFVDAGAGQRQDEWWE